MSVEATPEYDITRLLHLARLLTSDNAFLVSDAASVETILNLAKAPSCDADSGPYVDLLNSMTSTPPTYQGTDPIADITLTLRQLASCERSTSRSLLGKIGDFFMHRDGGKALRQLLLLSKVVIECLSLWYVLKQNNILGDVQSMQNFCSQAIAAHSVANVSPPDNISQLVTQSQQWDNNLATVVSTFRVGRAYPAPILLIFNEEALEEVMQATEEKSLPAQVEMVPAMTGSEEDTVPMTFVPRSQLRPFVEGYLGSGPVKQAVQM